MYFSFYLSVVLVLRFGRSRVLLFIAHTLEALGVDLTVDDMSFESME